MSLRADVPAAVRALGQRPVLLLVGVAIAAVGIVAAVVATVVTLALAPERATIVGPLLVIAAMVPVLPLLAGVYAPLAKSPTDSVATVRQGVDAVVRSYARLLAVAALATVVAAGFALLLVLVWLPLDTLVRYVRYAVADPGEPYATESLFWLVGTLVVGVSVGNVLVRFADTAVVFDDRGPREALWTSLRFARHHALSLAGFYLLVGAIGVLASILAAALPAMVAPDGDPLVALVATVAVAGAALTLIAAVQATYYRRTVSPAVEFRPEAGGLPWRRMAMAAVVLLAAVGGAVVVRSGEIRPIEDDRAALPDDPGAAYETALENTVSTSHRVEMTFWNRTESDQAGSRTTRALDYADREMTVFIHGEDIILGGYFDPGVLGIYPGGEQPMAEIRRDEANWSRLSASGYGTTRSTGEEGYEALPRPDADWRVAERSADELVLRIDDPDAVERATEEFTVYGGGLAMREGSYVEVTVDRDERVLVRGVAHLETAAAGDLEYVTTFEDVGTADVERPPALGERRPAEWFWATLYY